MTTKDKTGLAERGAAIIDRVARLRAKLAEQDLYLQELELWGHVYTQGLDEADVTGFGFDDGLLTPEQRRDNRRAVMVLRRAPYNAADHYNYVTVEGGGRRVLNPPLRRPVLQER